MDILDPQFSGRFALFTPSHVITMVLIACLWIVLPIVYRRKGNEKTDTIFRRTLAGILVGQYLLWMLWEALTGRFTLGLSLPLNLCDMSNFLLAALLMTKSYALFEVLYFWALAGTIQSFITPNIYYSFPHLEFFVFYIQHGGEILCILYLTIVSGLRPRPISMVKSMGYMLLFVGLVYVFNLLTGSNYMFLMADTPVESTISKMIRLFGQPPRHIMGLGLVSVVSIAVLYIPFAVKDLLAKMRSTAPSPDPQS